MPEIRIGQGDKDGTTLVANIYDNGEPFTLTNYTVRFAMRLPFDMAYYSVVGTVSGNTATFAIDESYAASVAGVTEVAYVEVLSGTTIICSTNRIRVVCLESAYENVDPAHLWDNGVEQFLEDAQDTLDATVAQAQSDVSDAVGDADAATSRATAAAEAAEGAIINVIPTMSETIKGGAKVGAGLQVIDGVLSTVASVLEYDTDTGEYTNQSIKAMFDAQTDSGAYGVQVPKSASVACTKTGANASIAVPEPGIIGRAAVDPYTTIPAFRFYEVNGYVDADGVPHVTAISGDGRFSRDGSNGNVWIMAPVLYWLASETNDYAYYSISKTKLTGMSVQPCGLLPDGTQRPYMLYSKYPLGMYDGQPASVSGVKPRNRDVSHNSLITICSTATTGYSGKSIADDWYVKLMFLLKYATKNSQSVFGGCTSYTTQAHPTVAESGVTRVILSNANADELLVGSACMMGNQATESTDRNNANCYNVFDGLKITAIETYDADNKAVYFDTATPFDTETTYLLSTSPWFCGACDDVEGDGSPYNPRSNKEPFVIQGIETMHGLYEIVGDVILSNDGTTGWTAFANYDSKNEATSVTANYVDVGAVLATDSTDGWKYPMYQANAGGLIYGAGSGASQSSGVCDGTYTNKLATTGMREWLGLGHLVYGGSAGLWCVYGVVWLGHESWVFGSRLSGVGRSRG